MSRVRKSLFVVNKVRPDYATATRAVASFLPPILLGIATGNILAGSVGAFVAQLAALLDTGGSFQRRLGQVLAFVVVAVAIVGLGIVAADQPIAVTALMAAAAFCGAVLTIYGAFGTAFGMGLPVLTLVMLSFGAPVSQTWELMGFALLAGLWASVVSMIPWVFLRDRPANQALAQILSASADLARELAVAPSGSGDSVELAAARERFGSVLAQNLNHAKHAKIDGSKVDSLRKIALAEDAIFTLITIREQEVTELSQPRTDNAVGQLYSEVADYLDLVSEAIRSGRNPSVVPQEVRDHIEALTAEEPQMSGSLKRLKAVLDRADTGGGRIGGSLPTWLEVLGAQLNWSSTVMRHATRLSVTAAVATLIYLLTGIPEGAWIILTVVVLMKPDLGATLDRLAQRLTGTIIGVVVGGVLIVVLSPYPVLMMLVGAVLLFWMVALVRLNYLFWVLPLTPFVLLTLALVEPGDWELGWWRLLNTLIGAGLAIAATYLLWPSKASTGYSRALARQLNLTGKYLSGVATAIPGDVRRRLQAKSFYAENDARQTLRVWRNDPEADDAQIRASEQVLSGVSEVRTLVMLFDATVQQGASWDGRLLTVAQTGIATVESEVDPSSDSAALASQAGAKAETEALPERPLDSAADPTSAESASNLALRAIATQSARIVSEASHARLANPGDGIG